jgi:hypothetical protein
VTWLRAYPSLTCMTKLSKLIRLQRRPITSLIRRPVHPAIDGAFVDVEEGHVVTGDLVQLDDELHEVGVGLLPEGFLALAEEIVEQRCDVVGERICVEVVVQRVVAVLGVHVELDVVVLASVPLEDVFNLVAEVALHFEYQPADVLLALVSPVGDQLLSAYGYMQPQVLPVPIAPKIAIPVKGPRSGTVNQ